MDVRGMRAIGRRGQLGLGGRLPWEGETSPEFRADVERFWAVTRGHVVLAGPATFRSIPAFAHAERTIVELHSNMAPEATLSLHPGRTVFIGGGPPVWAAYARLIRHRDITRLPYDGPADRWFDTAWVTAG